MKDWFLARTPNERLALIAGAAFLALVLFYLAVWHPLGVAVERKRQQVEQQQKTLAWMQRAAAEVKSYRSLGRTGARPASGEALLSLVDRTARNHGLRDKIRRLKPHGEQEVQLWLDGAPFDDVVKWLGDLEKSRSVMVQTATFDRQEQSGLTNAHITLVRPAS